MSVSRTTILTLKRRFARLMIGLEHVTLALWRPSIWTLFFCALWMFQIPVMLGHVASIITALLYIAGLLTLLYKDLPHLKHGTSIDRRLERDSGVAHRPLSSLDDQLANPEKTQTWALWDTNKDRLRAALPRLKFIAPKAFLAASDPYALRFGVLLFFLCGLLVSGHGWDARMRYGAAPFSFNNAAAMQRGVQLWITPPAYTKAEQIILSATDESEEPIKIPAGSILKLRITGGLGAPTLHIDEQKWPLERAGKDSYIIEREIPPGQQISVKQFLMTRAAWRYEHIPDTAPIITLGSDAPQRQPDGALRFPMTLHDDYGVKTLNINATLGPTIIGPPIGGAIMETRSIISPAGKNFQIAPLYDLTSHPWAGLPARLTFTATDHVGHSATTTPIEIVIPERIFRHPIAQKLIALRKELIWGPEGDHTDIARALERTLFRPDLYQHDQIAFLALRSASSRLFYEKKPTIETASAVARLLWDTALRIEDGNLTLAARNVRDTQNDLEQALSNPEATPEEIAKLMTDLRNAMAQYFTELQKEMQKREAEGDNMIFSPDMLSQIIDPDALANFLDQMQAEMMNGDPAKAREMLSQLQRMMDMFSPSMAAPMPPDMQMMADGVNELQALIENQGKLLKTITQKTKAWDMLISLQSDLLDSLPPLSTQSHKTEQESLRYILGQLMLEAADVLDEIPEGMGKAEREMFSAATLLGENQPKLSIPHQELALKYLKDAQKQLSQQFAQRMQQMTGFAFNGGQMRRDPLGRAFGQSGRQSGLPGEPIEIPDAAERNRAQEILRELRRRSGELNRPRAEREYFRRLLKQF